MASDPEQLPDAPPHATQSHKSTLGSILFANNASYTSPYSSSSPVSRPVDQSRNGLPQPSYRQPDFSVPSQTPHYANLNSEAPASQSSYQHRSPAHARTLSSIIAPNKTEYRSPYQSLQQETLRTPPNVHAASSFQYSTASGNGYQGQQMGYQEGFTTPPRIATSIESSHEELGPQRLVIGSSSPRIDGFHSGRGDEQGIDNVAGGILREQLYTEGLDTDMDVGQENGINPAEYGSSGEDEDDDEDRDAYEYDEPEDNSDESDFLDDSDRLSRDDDEISDTDTVYREHEANLRALKKEILKVRAIHKDSTSNSKHNETATAKRRRAVPKGPRKIAELTGDIRMKLGRANQLFFEQKYSEARKEAQDIIRINAEVWQAYSLLALIFKEWGEFDQEIISLISSCHFKPKEESGMAWLELARRIDEVDYESRQNHLADGVYCCSAALKILKNDVEALCLKGGFNRELGRVRTAIGDYENALREDPYNPRAICGLADCHLDVEKPELAKNIYEEAINFYRESGPTQNRFGWHQIIGYVELYASAGQFAEAIRHLRSLSRWIHGREEESYWDEITDDDREWDIDDLRRNEVPSYQPDRYDSLTYGYGLPIQLRTKLGVYRLKLGNFQEAMVQFRLLEEEGQFSDEEGIADLADLFQEVGDKLCEARYYDDALNFYEVLKQRVPNYKNFSYYLNMGKCYFQVGESSKAEDDASILSREQLRAWAEDAFLDALAHDQDSILARQELVKFYEAIDDKIKATAYRQEIKDLIRNSDEKPKPAGVQPETPAKAFITRKESKPHRTRRKEITTNENAALARKIEDARIADLIQCYETVQQCNDGLKAGDAEATSKWMAAAAELVVDFRTCKGLYPYDKYSYARSQKDKENAMEDENRKAAPDEDIEDTPTRGQKEEKRRYNIPTGHLGLSWATWLDILLQYALSLAKDHRHLDAYDVCISAKEAVVYFHDQEAMFTIYLCWCTCAVLANDMDTVVSQMRHFMKEYQFTTDSYRLFATLVRLCQSPLSHLTKGPTTKFILRNIKAMDYSILGPYRGAEEFSGKASYTAREPDGKTVVAKEMDICLLLLYGHILYVNSSFGKALHYLFRAYSLDPNNSMINMSVGLCYIQYAIKRQTHDRPYVIMQGISFLQKYYEKRKLAPRLEEREEAHYNMARTYHMLGLNHLAIPFYLKVLREAEEIGEEPGRDDLVVEAAYNLQTLYTVAGNAGLAKAVTEKWLVI